MNKSATQILKGQSLCLLMAMLAGCTGSSKDTATATAPSPANAGASVPAPVAADAPADLILEGGEIMTSGGWAQALAVRGGVLVEVRSTESVKALKGAATRVVELKGATVIPGLHDLHVHAIGAGDAALRCAFAQGSAPQAVLEVIRGCVARKKSGEWVTGGQWDAGSFGATPINKAFLDQVSPANPVALNDISMHAVWLNSDALKRAGITRDTPDPPGGVIDRDASGEPTGVLRESARSLLDGHLPAPSVEDQAKALLWAQREMLSHGVTSYTDAGIGEQGLQAYALLADRGQLKPRVRGCIA